MHTQHANQSKIQFENFVWIDFCQPAKASLDLIAKEYQLDLFQIKDSLEHGHLPKFEKQPNYNFLILRAFTSTIKEGATTINELSNKIAFFYNDSKLITVHRSPFDFLENDEEIRSGFYKKYDYDKSLLVEGIYLENKKNGQ